MSLTPAIMLQGTGSNVGKTLLVAGLARAFNNRGLRVAPFKPQNMSNNAGIAEINATEFGEIGRAQILQAKAARVQPSVHMNPVLLKPETDIGAQIIVQGKMHGTMNARDYGTHKQELLPYVLESFDMLQSEFDLILIEGAGSTAESNLRKGDIANMGFATAASVPVLMVGDIDRGGVIANLVGTKHVISEADNELIKGFMINKFRGNVELFNEGICEIVIHTGWDALGVIPFFDKAHLLPAEDILDLKSARSSDQKTLIAVPRLPRISNFDDLDPLQAETNADVQIIEVGAPMPANADLILLVGSKSTIADLKFLNAQGWDIDIKAHVRQGKKIVGLCGGYQMLGKTISDPEGIEGTVGTVKGLDILNVETVLSPSKSTRRVSGVHRESDLPVEGYEIHIGQTTGPDCECPMFVVDGQFEGAASQSGLACGTYLHGIFGSDRFRAQFLEDLGAVSDGQSYDATTEAILDQLAEHLEANLDLDAILKIAQARAA